MNYTVLMRTGQIKLVSDIKMKQGVDTLNMDGVLVEPKDAHRHMLKPMALQEGATIRSALTLLAGNETLQSILSEDIGPFLQQAFGPEPDFDISGGIEPDEVEFAMLYRYVYRNQTAEGVELEGLECPMFCGVGRPLEAPVMDHGVVFHEKGERIHYGFSMTSVRFLLDIPLRLESSVSFCAVDFGMQEDVGTLVLPPHKLTEVYQMPHFKLIEVLEGMMNELCYISKS